MDLTRRGREPRESPAGRRPDRIADLVGALRRSGVRDVSAEEVDRVAYSADASLYRVRPLAVVFPRHPDEVAAVLDVARAHEVPLTARGAGTSVAGNAVGPGLVLDFSRHLNRVLELDPAARTATVQPGVVQAALQRAAAPHGLRFGPDPSTHTRCTIGGMIGNDACGSRSPAYGRTADNVIALIGITGAGEPVRTGPTGPAGAGGGGGGRGGAGAFVEPLRAVVAGGLAPIRTELGRFDRQISGYALQNLLPENGFDLTRMLVGSEGTLALLTEATVRLVPNPAHRALVVLGFPDFAAAGYASPAVVRHRPTACEGLDARIVDTVRERRGPGAVPELPRGGAWLFVELSGQDPAELLDRTAALVAGIDAVGSRVVTAPGEMAALWRIREDGAGLAGRAPSGRAAWPGWEDAAVPPSALGDYLTEFDALVADAGLTMMPFGHFGEGCLHVRLDFDLNRPADFRAFLTTSAALVARHGGSLSGEHGDGRARSELLPAMYSAEMIRLFGAVKAVFDPANLLNPGVIVDPAPLDAQLRVPPADPARRMLLYPADAGSLAAAVHRCTGVGRCRVSAPTAGAAPTVMCPSFQATEQEKDSTRARARVLQDLVAGRLPGGVRSPAVHDALDLCLSCKGCVSDCPTGIDMAAYKAEVLSERYRWRLRPRAHYALGMLPRWARLAARAPGLANRLMGAGSRQPLARWAAGVDRRRSVPAFAPRTLRAWFETRAGPGDAGDRPGDRPAVVLFADTFTDHFSPQVGIAAVRVLESAGYRVHLAAPNCCGLTWISTGQLGAARRILRRTVADLAGWAGRGIPVVGLEPSCTAVLRHDSADLLGTPAAAAVAAATRTLAEVLTGTPGWAPPDLSGLSVVAQPHCHHQSVLGWEADAAVLDRAGALVTRLGGCCGLAGNWGVERGHYEVSVAVAGTRLLPALALAPDDPVLADGFSCRTQIGDLAGRNAVHLAQLLAGTGGGPASRSGDPDPGAGPPPDGDRPPGAGGWW